MRWLLLVLLLVMLPHSGRAGGHHIRVVLDTSLSMELKNDKARLAVLATLLLHDLARPNDTRDDSFEVIPFPRDWLWQPGGSPPAPASLRPIAARFPRRTDFARQLHGFPTTARRPTSIRPCRPPSMVGAVADGGGRYDTRTIVLVTDGLPEPEVRELDQGAGPRQDRASAR